MDTTTQEGFYCKVRVGSIRAVRGKGKGKAAPLAQIVVLHPIPEAADVAHGPGTAADAHAPGFPANGGTGAARPFWTGAAPGQTIEILVDNPDVLGHLSAGQTAFLTLTTEPAAREP